MRPKSFSVASVLFCPLLPLLVAAFPVPVARADEAGAASQAAGALTMESKPSLLPARLDGWQERAVQGQQDQARREAELRDLEDIARGRVFLGVTTFGLEPVWQDGNDEDALPSTKPVREAAASLPTGQAQAEESDFDGLLRRWDPPRSNLPALGGTFKMSAIVAAANLTDTSLVAHRRPALDSVYDSGNGGGSRAASGSASSGGGSGGGGMPMAGVSFSLPASAGLNAARAAAVAAAAAEVVWTGQPVPGGNIPQSGSTPAGSGSGTFFPGLPTGAGTGATFSSAVPVSVVSPAQFTPPTASNYYSGASANYTTINSTELVAASSVSSGVSAGSLSPAAGIGSGYGASTPQAVAPVRTSAGSFADLTATAPVQANIAPQFVGPQTSALPTGQTLYISELNGIISSATGNGGTVSTFKTISTTNALFGIGAFGGSLFVVEQNANAIDRVVISTGAVSTFASLGGTNSLPTALAIDTTGNIYVTLSTTSTIIKITTAGVVSTFATLPAGSQPQGLGIAPNGNLYSANAGLDSISQITPAGVVTTLATFTGAAYPAGLYFGGLTVDKNGIIYVVDQETTSGALGNVYKVTAGGAISFFASVGANTQPIGLAFDSNSVLYTANAASISQITPAGVVSTFATDGNGPDFLVIPVPEPATWIGGAATLAAALLALRRRMRRSAPVA